MEKEWRQFLSKEQPQVYDFVNKLFDISPPPPLLFVGSPKREVYKSQASAVSGAAVSTYYLEREKRVIIDPIGIFDLIRIGRKHELTIDPGYQAVRSLAQGYANHCISFLHGFKTREEIEALWTEESLTSSTPHNLQSVAEWFVKMAQPITILSAVSYVTSLKAAKEFGHDDNYLDYFDRNMKLGRASTRELLLKATNAGAVDILIEGMSYNLPQVQQVGITLSFRLADSWKDMEPEKIRAIARSSFAPLNEEEIKEYARYLTGE